MKILPKSEIKNQKFENEFFKKGFGSCPKAKIKLKLPDFYVWFFL
jgi:hypothetical protein